MINFLALLILVEPHFGRESIRAGCQQAAPSHPPEWSGTVHIPLHRSMSFVSMQFKAKYFLLNRVATGQGNSRSGKSQWILEFVREI